MPPSAKDRKKVLEWGVVIMGGDREKHRNEGQAALETFGRASPWTVKVKVGLDPLQSEASLASVNARLRGRASEWISELPLCLLFLKINQPLMITVPKEA